MNKTVAIFILADFFELNNCTILPIFKKPFLPCCCMGVKTRENPKASKSASDTSIRVMALPEVWKVVLRREDSGPVRWSKGVNELPAARWTVSDAPSVS